MSTSDATLGSHLPHSALTPVFTGLRIGLHILVTVLTVFVIVRASFGVWPWPGFIVALACLFLGTYIAGSYLVRTRTSAWIVPVWLLLLMALWLLLTVLSSDAAYTVFPLFFLQLHVLPLRWGIPAVLVSVVLAIGVLGLHFGWNLGAILGPLIGAGVAVAIGLGYRAMLREAEERQSLIRDLISTRAELASTEREAGTLSERERLAREIHDTLAQGLSSIQLLLHAAERTMTDAGAISHVRLARETASTNLQEARRFIRELTPAALDTQTLPGALKRLAESTAAAGVQASGIGTAGGQASETTLVSLQVTGDAIPLPMRLEATLLRIAQGSLANVTQHAESTRAEVTLSYMTDEVALDIVDNGRGFQVSALETDRPADSFGLVAIRQRVEQLGGTLIIESTPGKGTAIAVTFPLSAASASATIASAGTTASAADGTAEGLAEEGNP